jgi:hypothetical protein
MKLFNIYQETVRFQQSWARFAVALAILTFLPLSLRAQTCTPAPSGLVSWWQAEGNANDTAITNNGALQGGVDFVAGEVGQAFNFNGTSGTVVVPDSPSLRLTSQLTVEAWINTRSTNTDRAIVSKLSVATGLNGYQLLLSQNSLLGLFNSPGQGWPSSGISAPVPIVPGTWNHVAWTYDQSAMTLYFNGVPVATNLLGPKAIATSASPLWISGTEGSSGAYFDGQIDEPAVYNTALTATQIQAIYNAGSAGKCLQTNPPVIVSQPVDQTLVAGGNVSFSVVASGPAPLTYLWTWNGTNIPGATNTTLTLGNVQSSQSGNYAVLVSNPYGSVTSSNAVLTVTSAPVCTPPPSGLVGWWQAEADATDSAGTNNGTLQGGVGFAAGEVSQAFNFDGVSGRVVVPDSPSLRLTSQLTVEAWINTRSTNTDRAIVSKLSVATGLNGYQLVLSKNSLLGQFNSPGQGWPSSGISAPVPIVPGTWNHVAWTYDQSTMTLYFNGVPVATNLLGPKAIATSASPLWISGTSGSSGAYFDGQIDEPAVYNTALSATQIQAIYNAGSSGKCSTTTAPTITTQPQSQTVFAGSAVTFGVQAGGTVPLTYQWNVNGTNISGATNSSLVLGNVQLAQAGNYAVQVANAFGSAISSNAVLTVIDLGPIFFDNFEPDIHWLQWSAFGGNTVANNVGGSVSGTNSLWFGGIGSRYATTRSLNTTTGGVVQFYIRLANLGSYPWNQPLLPGNGVVLEYASGTGTTWKELGRYDTTNYFNWTFVSVSIPAGGQTAGTSFRWRQLNNFGDFYDNWALDDVAVIVGSQPPLITTQPAGRIVAPGATVNLSVQVIGSASLSYQWLLDGVNLPGATASTLTFTNAQTFNSGTYAVVITNSYGSVTSSNAILTVTPAPTCTPSPSGLVSWWAGEGDASDTFGANPGILQNGVSFASGKVGTAFDLNGTSQYVDVPDSPSLNPTGSLSLEAWIYPRLPLDPVAAPIIKKAEEGTTFQEHGYGLELFGTSGVRFGVSLNGGFGWALTDAAPLPMNQWSHVVGVFDGTNAMFYFNGVLVGTPTAAPGQIVPSGNHLQIGHDPGNPSRYFNGLIDEPGVYATALSAAQVQALYNAGSAGKCTTPVAPSIVGQPQSQTINAGANASFGVMATGSRPLTYQWQFNGVSLAGATNSGLILASVQPTNAGTYSVVITNAYGSVTSSNAQLTVNVPVCTPTASGLVAWWQGQGNAGDFYGLNNGQPQGGLAFATGKVTQGFAFDGTSAYVSVPASPSLNVGAGAGLTVECWIKPADLSGNQALVEWNNGSAGVHFWISQPTSSFGGGPGCLYANIRDASGTFHYFTTGGGLVTTNGFQHVALTYDKASGLAMLYYNGALVTVQSLGSFTPQTSYNLFLGRRPSNDPPGSFKGLMDEVGLYNRALSGSEIAAIYNADSAGRCVVPLGPSIVAQPQSKAVSAGANVSFSVTAAGTSPFSYQWQFNGADLAGATNALLNLTGVQPLNAGDYSVVVSNALGFVTSSNATLVVNTFPPAIASQPQSKTVTAGITVSFSVVASGTSPFGYQWQKNGGALIGATGSLLSLTNVQVADAGIYSVVVTNLYGSVLSSNATLTVLPPPSLIKVVSVTATSGIVTVPINLIAQGSENALGFSLNFNNTALTFIGVTLGSNASGASLIYNTNQLASGRVGVALSLPFNTSFTAGTKELVEVSFFAVPRISTVVTALSFGDAPIVRQVSDVQAGALSASYVGGNVTIPFLGYEGDVSPRTTGNNIVSITDWVQIGRFVGGLDTITNAGEFQKADCAPRSTLGNGLLTVADWVQAGRYAASLDPLTMAGGPTADLSGDSLLRLTAAKGPGLYSASGRSIRIPNANATAGQACQVTVQLDSLGDENAVGISLNFDPAVLTFVSATLGSGATGASFIVNTNQISIGKLGLALGLPIGSAFNAATQELAKLNFVVAPSASGNAAFSLGAKPVAQEVVNVTAQSLPTTYVNGVLAITAQVIVSPTLKVTQANGSLVLSWPASATGFGLESSANLTSNSWTSASGAATTNATDITVTIPTSGSQQFYRLHHP